MIEGEFIQPPPRDTFDQIVSGTGLSNIGEGENGISRINRRVTQETVFAINRTIEAEGVSLTESVRRLLGVGIYTDNFHEAEIPLVEIELQTGEEKPFSTETTLLHVTPETQIEVFPEDHHLARVKRVDVVVNGPMVAAETLFSERYACTEHEAFNALVRRGDITVNVLRDPDKGLAILDQDGRKKDIVYFPGNGPTESA